MPRLYGCLLCVLACAPLARAHAQLPVSDPPRAETGDSPAHAENADSPLTLAAEVALNARRDAASSTWITSPVLGAAYALPGHIELAIEWGFVLARDAGRRGAAQWAFGLGNPQLTATFELLRRERERLRTYVGFVPPGAWLPNSPVERGLVRGSLAYASAARGLWNAWLWGPEQVAAVLGAQYAGALTPHVRAGADAAVAVSLPFSTLSRDLVDGFLQLAPYVEARVGVAALGARVQAVFMSASADALQLSASPYVRFELSPVSLQLRALLNLDPPLGVFADGLQTWGVLLSGAGRL